MEIDDVDMDDVVVGLRIVVGCVEEALMMDDLLGVDCAFAFNVPQQAHLSSVSAFGAKHSAQSHFLFELDLNSSLSDSLGVTGAASTAAGVSTATSVLFFIG